MFENALESKGKLNLEEKEGLILELNTQQENYTKVLKFIGFLIDSIKKTKGNLQHEVHQKNILEV